MLCACLDLVSAEHQYKVDDVQRQQIDADEEEAEEVAVTTVHGISI
jgi:cation transport regulator ChaB